MRKLICVLSFFVFGNVFSQNEIIESIDIPKLNSIIKKIESDYEQSEYKTFYSLPQTTGSCFEIKTKTPDKFLNELKKTEDINQLRHQFKGLQIDNDLLVIKNVYKDRDNKKIIEIKSFEIGNNNRHLISNENGGMKSVLNKNAKIYYSSYKQTWGKYKGVTNIFGFWLNEDFKSIVLPKKMSDWIHYTDVVVQPKTSIFYDNKNSDKIEYKTTILDSLVNYYERKSNKPPYRKEQDYSSRRKELNQWESKQNKIVDSLYKADENFKNLLLKALNYAEKNKVSNGYLEDFTAQLISKKRALELMRQNRKTGSCSFDDSPLIQLKRIAHLATKTLDWNIFIKSFLNVMNDNVSRNANSNIASDARKTYIEELAKLDLDIDKILLGSNMRIQDTIQEHYFSDGGKIAKAYTNLSSEKQEYFENAVSEILKNKEVDAFNKLHFYNTFKYYQYFLKDSIKKNEVEKKIKNLIPFLPKEIKSRIENSNKQLCDLLSDEKEELAKFDIQSSTIADIYCYSFSGDCWSAMLTDKNSDGKIIYALTMEIGEQITPLQNFVDKKEELKSRVVNHHFLQKIINQNKDNKVYIQFTTDRSFVNHKNTVTEDMPKELVSKLDFKNAISLAISFPNRRLVRFVLLQNGNLLLLEIPKGFTLPGFKFEELVTKKEEVFLSTIYSSFKLFDEKGRMLN